MKVEQSNETYNCDWGNNTFIVDIRTHNGYKTFIVLADSTKEAIEKTDKQILQDYFGADTKPKYYEVMGYETSQYKHKRQPTKFAYITYVEKRDLETILATTFDLIK